MKAVQDGFFHIKHYDTILTRPSIAGGVGKNRDF